VDIGNVTEDLPNFKVKSVEKRKEDLRPNQPQISPQLDVV